jgi:hypothetical protein
MFIDSRHIFIFYKQTKFLHVDMFTVQLRTKFHITYHNDKFVFATKMKASENFRTTTIL